jgi:hypothetical protein
MVSDSHFIVCATYNAPAWLLKISKKDLKQVSALRLDDPAQTAKHNLKNNVDNAAFVRYVEDGRLVVGSGLAPALLVEVDGSGLKVNI